MKYEIKNNEVNMCFETFIEGHKAELVYRLSEGKIYLMHTWVPKAIGGKGVGVALVEYALRHVIKHNIPLVVYCPFVKKYIKIHPDWREQLA